MLRNANTIKVERLTLLNIKTTLLSKKTSPSLQRVAAEEQARHDGHASRVLERPAAQPATDIQSSLFIG
jgi:hypothetical protein